MDKKKANGIASDVLSKLPDELLQAHGEDLKEAIVWTLLGRKSQGRYTKQSCQEAIMSWRSEYGVKMSIAAFDHLVLMYGKSHQMKVK